LRVERTAILNPERKKRQKGTWKDIEYCAKDEEPKGICRDGKDVVTHSRSWARA
jgi:hypothetical protein